MNKGKQLDIGAIWSSKNFGDFVITDILEKEKGKNRNIIIKFLNKNVFDINTTCRARVDHAREGSVIDYYQPRICGVACRGYATTKINGVRFKEYEIWMNMINRCYNPKNEMYYLYGGKGVTVCKRWLCYEYFYNDLPSISGYELWKNNQSEYHLDKDILQQNVPIYNKTYSPQTCIFVSKLENILHTNHKQSSSGYVGVFIVNTIYSGIRYKICLCGRNYGTFTNPIAAANMYNIVARAMGYPEDCLNKVPYMDGLEVLKYRVPPKVVNGKVTMAVSITK